MIEEVSVAGGHSVDSSKVVGKAADIIATCVTTDPQVEKVILGEDGALEGAIEGKLIVDMSSISPLTVRELAKG